MFCMQLASACGLNVAETKQVILDKKNRVALIKRYDRRDEDGVTKRLHQEDFCQALGAPPELKYQSDGGPDLHSCAKLIRDHSTKAGRDMIVFIDWVIFNIFIGNCDAHAKNISLLFKKKWTRACPIL